MQDPTVFSPLLGTGVTLGNLAIWLGLASAVACVVLYWTAMIRGMVLHPDPARGSHAPEAASDATDAANGNGNGKGARKNGAVPPKPAAEQRTERIQLWARRCFYFTCACVALAALSFWTLILNKEYVVEYISKNSNNKLPFGYRFASFWSEQEGTFLLWTMYNAVLGSVFLWRARKDERWVMPFFTLINVSLFTLLTFMNPFWMISPGDVKESLLAVMGQHAFSPSQQAQVLALLPVGAWQHLLYYFGWFHYFVPSDGHGLNESLQNFWMVIHPPTLFVGYSSMIIPACFALAALMRRDYDGWVDRAAPWLAFSWGVLGTGIFLGAYWAYETLGWGGYWSWDPVENSSIIPWVIGTALIHGMLGQRNRGNFKQANLFLGVLVGNAVLLSSFLVRSGVLSDSSKHAFATPQAAVFWTLLVVMVVWFVMSMGIWCWRFRDINSEIAYENVWERHFGFFLGLIVLIAVAAVITFGVTLPIWKPWLWFTRGARLSVDFTFYNKALLPVVFTMVLLLGITPLMPWKQRSAEDGGPRPLKPFSKVVLVLSGLVTLFFLASAVYAWQGGFRTHEANDPAFVAFGLMLAIALVTNFVCMSRAARGGFLNTGPWFAHVGFLVILAGIVVSSRFNEVHSVQKLSYGETTTVLGRQFRFMGQRPANTKIPGDKDRMLIDMVANGKTYHFDPKLFISEKTNEAMAWPQIRHEWFGGAWGDVYVEPSGVDTSGAVPFSLKKDQWVDMPVQRAAGDPTDTVSIRFMGLDNLAQMRDSFQGKRRDFTLIGDAIVRVNDGPPKEVRAQLRYPDGMGGDQISVPIPLEGLHQPIPYVLSFAKTNINPNDLQVEFDVRPTVPVDPQGFFQVLWVPGIQVLWFGNYILIFGAALCYLRRRRLAAREPALAPKTSGVPAPKVVEPKREKIRPARQPEPAPAD